MTDYRNSVKNQGDVYPENKTDGTWKDSEPLITPELLRVDRLFGIPLVSGMVDPITRQAQVMTDAMLQRYIVKAVAQARIDIGIDIMPTAYKERREFDRGDYNSFGFLRVEHVPLASVERLAMEGPTGYSFFEIPPQWIDPGNFRYGQLNIVPLAPGGAPYNSLVIGAIGTPSVSGGGASFNLAAIIGQNWIPAFWTVEYTTGFPDGKVPREINSYVSAVAAIDVLSQLAAARAMTTSRSLSIDAMSQSVAGPGPQVYMQRIAELTAEKDRLASALRTTFGQRMFSWNL